MRHELGTITIVQEGRFRLSSDDGRSLLFILDHGAALEPQDLPRLVSGPRVEVACSPAEGRRALVAHEIRWAPA